MKRPEQHRTGDLGETMLRGEFLRCGWIVEPIGSDYGYDFFLQPTDGDRVLAEFALLQSKAVSRPLRLDAAGNRVYRLQTKYLTYWESCPLPAFLGVTEIPTGQIWLASCHEVVTAVSIRAGPEWKKQQTQSIRFHANACLTQELMALVRKEVDRSWDGIRPTKMERLAMLANVSDPMLAWELAPHWFAYVARQSTIQKSIEATLGASSAEPIIRKLRESRWLA